jgi:hypothetical protein
MNPGDIQAISEDLEFLKSHWGENISDSEARRGSAILRRLLAEDVYGKGWRALGFQKEPKVIAVDIKNVLGQAPQSDVELALAGGVTIGGVSMFGVTILKRDHKANLGAPITPNGFPGEREFTISEYLKSETGILRGHAATRRDVIKYFANVKGGVHLGPSQKAEEKKLVARMEKFEKKVSLLRKDGLLCELIAIGHSVGRSPDTQRFLEKAYSWLEQARK